MIHRLNQTLRKNKKLAVGLMSGTSLDGVDSALVEIEDSGLETRVRLLHFETLPFSPNEREQILQLCSPTTSSVDEVCRMNVYLGQKFADAALMVIKNAGKTTEQIDFISSHGQTIYHMPKQLATLQIGELAVIAERTGCITVGDFRPNDMAAGGQGAPLVPYVDYLLFRKKDSGRILINIGGISNMTILPANTQADKVIAFDTGPGNVLIDAMVRMGTNGELSFDDGGKIADQGTACQEWLEQIIAGDPYVMERPPKSTGRELYSLELAKKLWNEGNQRQLSFEDIVATITAYTSQTISMNIKEHIDPYYETTEVLVGGGGIHNEVLMKSLQAELKQEVTSMEKLNFSSDAKEAIAFAILGNECLHGRPNNLPSATGADRPVVMGKLVMP
jgi:anhydro-N-acetylmuramic acid kinase